MAMSEVFSKGAASLLKVQELIDIRFEPPTRLLEAFSGVSVAEISNNDTALLLLVVVAAVVTLSLVVAAVLGFLEAMRFQGLRFRGLLHTTSVLLIAAMVTSLTLGCWLLFLNKSFSDYVEAEVTRRGGMANSDVEDSAFVIPFLLETPWLSATHNLAMGSRVQWLITSQRFYVLVTVALALFVEGFRCRTKRRLAIFVFACAVNVSWGLGLLLIILCNHAAGNNQRAADRFVVPLPKFLLFGSALAIVSLSVLPDLAEPMLGFGVAYVGLLVPVSLAFMFPGYFYRMRQPSLELTRRTAKGEVEHLADPRPLQHFWLVTTYGVIAGWVLNATVQQVVLVATEAAEGGMLIRLARGAVANPSQMAASADTIGIYAILFTYFWLGAGQRIRWGLAFGFSTLLMAVGPAATLPLFLAYREHRITPVVLPPSPEPSSGRETRTPPPPGAPASNQTTAAVRARFVAFFEHYDKEKLDRIDALLSKYVGREDVVMTALVEKYGPEPAEE